MKNLERLIIPTPYGSRLWKPNNLPPGLKQLRHYQISILSDDEGKADKAALILPEVRMFIILDKSKLARLEADCQDAIRKLRRREQVV